MRKAEFFKNLEIDDADKVRAEKALYSKGLEKHILIKNYLTTWRSGETETVARYSEIASIYRYDKRIRNMLLK